MGETKREKWEAREALWLSEKAVMSKDTRGRERYETPCPIRTEFQRDRDRIIHSKAFRRMKHKTEVFIAPAGDHYRTRLTHTLEVSQIARSIARALSLNEDLTEAIALGHDLGHTPFGHAGERALNEVFPDGFRHNEQSIRVVKYLERDGAGLNLTYEVLNGILCHKTSLMPDTLEGQIVRLSDKIAYINHDIDDAVRAGIISENDIPPRYRERFGNTLSDRINSMVLNVVENSDEKIRMDGETSKLFYEFREFLFENLYYNPICAEEVRKACDIVKWLYDYYNRNVVCMSDEYIEIKEKEGRQRAVCDYISGMTDQYAVEKFKELFIPQFWSVK